MLLTWNFPSLTIPLYYKLHPLSLSLSPAPGEPCGLGDMMSAMMGPAMAMALDPKIKTAMASCPIKFDSPTDGPTNPDAPTVAPPNLATLPVSITIESIDKNELAIISKMLTKFNSHIYLISNY